MGLFDKKYKKTNEQNKQKIINVLDELMNVNAAYTANINSIKNALLNQPAAEGKEVAKIDEQIILSLSEAKRLLAANKAREANTYLDKAKQMVAQRIGSSSSVKVRKGAKVELTAEDLNEILLAKAQDEVSAAANRYNELKQKADRGDMVARSQLTAVFQQYQIANQNFTALSNNQNRETIARMMQTFTEEQKQRIANRSVSDEELSVLMNQYSQVSATIMAEANDVNNLAGTIGGVSGAMNSMQNQIDQNMASQVGGAQASAMPQSLNVPGTAMGTGMYASAMPQSLNVPGTDTYAGAMPQSLNAPGVAGVGANPFMQTPANANPFMQTNANSQFGSISDNQLHGVRGMLESQIDKLKEDLEEKRSNRQVIDRKMRDLLQKHADLPDAQARLLESEIDGTALETENSDFELNMIEQEIRQAQENLGIVTKLLSMKTREQRDQMLSQRFGGQFNVENFAMMIANAQEKYNEDLQRADDANAVARAQNTNVSRSTVDASASLKAKKKDYSELKKFYGVTSGTN